MQYTAYNITLKFIQSKKNMHLNNLQRVDNLLTFPPNYNNLNIYDKP